MYPQFFSSNEPTRELSLKEASNCQAELNPTTWKFCQRP